MPRVRTLTPGASPMHHFGAEVRRARESAGMTQSDLGDLVPCDKATVSRIEAGLTQPDEAFARACDSAFPQMNGWYSRFWADAQSWGAGFTPAFRDFASYEAKAVTLWGFEHIVIPGLLQTEEYARAMLERHPNVTGEQVTDRVAARMARQAVLCQENPPMFWVLLDENTLHREVGGANIMHGQLAHLAGMATRPNITVQVIPRTGAHPGLLGAFAIAETPDSRVAYLEHIADGTTTDSPAIVAQVSMRFDALRTEAFRGTESLALIENAAEEWKA